MPEWLLIDGSSLIFRAFYGVPQTTRAPDGTLTNAVRGTLETLARLITERRPKRLAMGTDEDWRPDWRVELLPSYKEHRTAELCAERCEGLSATSAPTERNAVCTASTTSLKSISIAKISRRAPGGRVIRRVVQNPTKAGSRPSIQHGAEVR